MKIAVLIKQVPATDKVKIDEEKGTMIRKGIESELNPLDLYAVEESIRIKEKEKNVEIVVISMGPPNAIKAIKEALSMGCDKGYLLSDRKFGGADTLITAYTLSSALKKLGKFDIIFCGERATDGETGQVGPSIGAQLDIPVLTYVSKIEEIKDGKVRLQRAIEGGHEIVETVTPALISVVKEINEPRTPTLRGKINAKKIEIPIVAKDDLDVDDSKLGLKGSPTRVVKIFYPKLTRKGEIISVNNNLEEISDKFVDFLKNKEII